MTQLNALIFDLDGVITDTAEYHYQAWKNLAKKLNIEIDREFNEKLKGVSRDESLRRILEHGNQLDTYTEEEKAAFAKEKNDEYVQLIEAITPADILPGIAALLESAKNNGVKLALASASKNGPVILKRLGLETYFEVVVDPSTLKAGKPDPEIFEVAAEKLGVPVSQCVGVEDAEAGLQAINAANMFSVGVGDARVLAAADYNVASTSGLLFDDIKQHFENRAQ